MTLALIAAAYTFTATATGLQKGAPVEFFFAGKDTDRDYETLFILDQKVSDFCNSLENTGLKRGKSTNPEKCIMWPVGVTVTLEPPLSDFVETHMPEGVPLGSVIYTGGERNAKGDLLAEAQQPFALFALYTFSQAPLQFNGLYPQGMVYNSHLTKKSLNKGEKVRFTLSWKENEVPRTLSMLFQATNLVTNLAKIKEAAEKEEVCVLARFADELTVEQATATANALTVIDSRRVKINGRHDGEFFYRAFMPLVKWRDRQERLQQPFELTLKHGDVKLVFLEEDWSGEGLDPKLTEREISFAESVKYPKTDTCFIFADNSAKVGELRKYISRLPKSVKNWYIYGD